MSVTNQPKGRAAARKPASAGNRLPSARERRPALAALAVLLIAGGAVLAGWLALRESHTVTYLQMARNVQEGQQIEQRDITEVDLPEGHGSFIAADDRDEIVDSYAQTDLVEGQVLVPGLVGSAYRPGPGESEVGLALESGQAPTGIAVGDQVHLRIAVDDGSPGAPATGLVTRVSGGKPGEDTYVNVVMNGGCAGKFQAATGDVRVNIWPPSEDGEFALTCDASADEEAQKDADVTVEESAPKTDAQDEGGDSEKPSKGDETPKKGDN